MAGRRRRRADDALLTTLRAPDGTCGWGLLASGYRWTGPPDQGQLCLSGWMDGGDGEYDTSNPQYEADSDAIQPTRQVGPADDILFHRLFVPPGSNSEGNSMPGTNPYFDAHQEYRWYYPIPSLHWLKKDLEDGRRIPDHCLWRLFKIPDDIGLTYGGKYIIINGANQVMFWAYKERFKHTTFPQHHGNSVFLATVNGTDWPDAYQTNWIQKESNILSNKHCMWDVETGPDGMSIRNEEDMYLVAEPNVGHTWKGAYKRIARLADKREWERLMSQQRSTWRFTAKPNLKPIPKRIIDERLPWWSGAEFDLQAYRNYADQWSQATQAKIQEMCATQ